MRKTVAAASVIAIVIAFMMSLSLPSASLRVWAEEVSWDSAPDITELDVTDGTNTSKTDDHIYLFKAEEKGYTTFAFEHEKDAGDHTVTVYDGQKNEIFSAVIPKEIDSFSSPRFSINKGDHYIKIHSDENTKPYSISVQPEESTSWETEPNNQAGQSEGIPLNKVHRGSNVKKEDADYYTFETGQNGYITIFFGHKKNVGSHEITLYDGDQKVYTTINIRPEADTFTSQEIAVNKGKYYLSISSADNREAYRFSVNYVEADDWEHEFNNSFESANEIAADLNCYGSNVSGEDPDYYVFNMEKDGEVTLALTQRKDIAAHNITIYDGDQKEIQNIVTDKASEEYVDHKIPFKQGKYYIRIQALENTQEQSYCFRLTVEE